ncbi:unnamed protein product [Caenorhabditis auriculariae]|uniref:Coatomer subunit epsilon n=1 Tax=Caenorhabditis auriculariae TaxID=2777116 RepID=A0A8S1H6U8_9PELO|nr:unnamed protein product [Caenorhabditis auriculariae]
MSVDKLFSIRNYFFLGNYQSCIGEALKFSTKNEDEKIEKDIYLYRSFIAQGQAFIPLKEIPSDTKSSALASVRRYAEYRNDSKSKKRITSEVQSEASSRSIKDETSAVLAAIILNENGNPEDAFRAVARFDGIEARTTKIFTLVLMNKKKLAASEQKKLNAVDEDATLTQLSNALVTSVSGGSKVKDALYIYNEMADKYGRTTDLEMHQAIVSILTQDYEAAEELLNSAMERDSSDPDVLINSLVVGQFLEKDDNADRIISLLKHSHANHPWTVDYVNKEAEFDRLVAESSA